jgi:hypothetical protein
MNTSLFANISVQQIRQAATVKEKIETLQQEHQKQMAALELEFARLLGGQEAAVPAVKVAQKTPAKAAVKVATPAAKVTTKSKISAAGRANIIAAQKARWAKTKTVAPTNAVQPSQPGKAPQAMKSPKAATAPKVAKAPKAAMPVKVAAPAKPVASPKRNISPEGRARIIAGAKARWAKIRAAKAA